MLYTSYNRVPESHRRAALEQALYMLHDPRMFARGVLVQHRKGIPPERLGFLSHRESLLSRRESLPLWWESYLLPQLARAA